MVFWKYITGFALLGVAAHGASLPATVVKARELFEVSLQVAGKESKKSMEAIGDEYLQQLRNIENEMQANGQFRGLVTVHDEITRFGKARSLTGKPVDEPVELREAQISFMLRFLQVNYSNEVGLVRLAETYVQELATARGGERKHGNNSTVRALDEERDRVIALAALRHALETTKSSPPTAESLTNLTGSVSIAENERPRRQLDIFRAPNEPLQATIGYTVKVFLFEDVSKLKPRRSEGAGSKSRSIDGMMGYMPRITLSCQHGEIPSGSRLIIEYFSRSLTDRSRRREVVEQISLPRVDRSESYSVDAKGVQIYRSESVSSITRQGVSRSFAGSEFYGLILHVVDPDRHVLFQRFSPQSLEREVPATPPEK